MAPQNHARSPRHDCISQHPPLTCILRFHAPLNSNFVLKQIRDNRPRAGSGQAQSPPNLNSSTFLAAAAGLTVTPKTKA